MSGETLATIIATAVALGWILLMVCAAVLIGHLFAGPTDEELVRRWNQTTAADEAGLAEAEAEAASTWVLAEDPPTARDYVMPQPPIAEDVLPVAAKPKDLHRSCIVAYAEQDYAAICKTCTPRMGVRP